MTGAQMINILYPGNENVGRKGTDIFTLHVILSLFSVAISSVPNSIKIRFYMFRKVIGIVGVREPHHFGGSDVVAA
jgi:hypothetical protein